MRIGCVSDVCLGYGSPQIPYLAESLAQHYGAEVLVVEPHRADLPPRHNRFPLLQVRRAANHLWPYSKEGRIEYLLDAARILDDFAPDFLVLFCTFTVPVLFNLRRRPGFVLYYSYESIQHYGAFDVEMNGHLRGQIDAVVFPEENRAICEVQRFGFGDIPKLVLFNCPRRHAVAPLPKDQRNGRFLHAGTIDPVLTLASYYTLPAVQKHSIDLYGPVNAESDQLRAEFLAALGGQVHYCGRVESSELEALRRAYIYSLVVWNPDHENRLYAAPNKFFEAIADGVPPLAAPHPQCRQIIEQFHCGVLLPDWSDTAFVNGLDRAKRIFNTDEWDRMVANGIAAFHDELNWEAQFEKLKVHLDRQP